MKNTDGRKVGSKTAKWRGNVGGGFDLWGGKTVALIHRLLTSTRQTTHELGMTGSQILEPPVICSK